MSQESLPRTSKAIRIDEPTDAGVVISALEVVEPGFCVVVVAAVADGVDFADGVLVGSGDGQDIAPGIVLVLAEGCAQIADDADDIPLLVQDVVIAIPVVYAGIRQVTGIVDDVKNVFRSVFCPRLPDNLAVQRFVMIGDIAGSLAVTNARKVVSICDVLPVAGSGGKLPSFFPIERPTGAIVVAQRVADFVIGDGLAIVSRQQVLPIGIDIGAGSLSEQNITVLPGWEEIIYFADCYSATAVVIR